MSTAALILAAGESKRYGSPKQLIDWMGTPLLGHVVRQVGKWPVDSIYVVLGSNAEQIMESVDLSGTTVVENLEWEEGMASSIRVGLDALANATGFERTFIVLADRAEALPAPCRHPPVSVHLGKSGADRPGDLGPDHGQHQRRYGSPQAVQSPSGLDRRGVVRGSASPRHRYEVRSRRYAPQTQEGPVKWSATGCQDMVSRAFAVVVARVGSFTSPLGPG